MSAPVPTNEPLAAEAENWVDDGADSAFGGSQYGGGSTASIASSILKHRQENGRTYHAYKDGKYILPNDDFEQDRLDLQHHLWGLTLQNKLHLAPVGRDAQVQRVLDAGTGTGIWAIDFADENPAAHVIGIDLSPIQPSFVPPNVEFQIDDLEERWTFSDKFDFIFARMLNGSLADWPKFFQQSWENLNPGGYVEVADSIFPAQCDDGTLPADSALAKWGTSFTQAMGQFGRPIDSAKLYKQQLEDAGFVNVVQVDFKWPLNRWPKDPKFKELGMWTNENFTGSLSGISMAICTRMLGMTKEETEAFLVDVRKDMMNTNMHAYFPIAIVYGQKPM
ncbi:S-adenosyl-L-methionine-dependent methyltransferase-4 [Coleophoma cylindrospora]|uniref:S-adenosyl-L-methionine-dependent methyltransferase-4 n=1 Tax=Coleophoma cylindrospora TaxID=1849047 RepID=A0A3D8SFH2_9HELO|nr:S-adenosyl-L-methionine-dependent methyltransferase-4 [Coleophoma cylindrospora]